MAELYYADEDKLMKAALAQLKKHRNLLSYETASVIAALAEACGSKKIKAYVKPFTAVAAAVEEYEKVLTEAIKNLHAVDVALPNLPIPLPPKHEAVVLWNASIPAAVKASQVMADKFEKLEELGMDTFEVPFDSVTFEHVYDAFLIDIHDATVVEDEFLFVKGSDFVDWVNSDDFPYAPEPPEEEEEDEPEEEDEELEDDDEDSDEEE
jgi:hypothetical protein